MRIFALALAVLAMGFFDGRGWADGQKWVNGQGPIMRSLPIELAPVDPALAEPGATLVIEGVVSGAEAAPLVLRADDAASVNYASRVNREWLQPPGPFTRHVMLAGARTSGGRALDVAHLTRVMLFEPEGGGRVTLSRLAVEPPARLPAGVVGFAFGAAEAPALAGLSRIAPGDPRIVNGRAAAVSRPSPDPVVAHGLVGVERVKLAYPRGRALVSLWVEDVGEWETLPHPLQRRIRINGEDALYQWLTPEQWIQQRYLAGRDREAGPNDDAWTAYGRFRGGLISREIEVGDDGVTIELAGEGAAATFISAAVIERAGQSAGRDAVEAARRAWMIENFPVAPQAAEQRPLVGAGGDGGGGWAPLRAVLAPGTGARLDFRVEGPASAARPEIEVEAPQLGAAKLAVELYARQWRLVRPGADTPMLERRDDFLRGDPTALAVGGAEARPFLAWVEAPEDAAPGIYRGEIRIVVGETRIVAPLELEVLAAKLPPVARPAGFYLDEAPHLTWFEATREARGRQLTCDLETLRRFGALGDAPALGVPDAQGMAGFLDDERRAQAAGVAAPWLAYTPLKRLIGEMGLDGAAAQLREALRQGAAQGLPAPLWSLFDEPSNIGGEGAVATAARLRELAPGVKLAGQFNAPEDWRFLPAVDVALVNPGFGVDAATIARIRAQGRDAWIYNTGAPRLTAGFWLWLSGASRYLQWHARMPTADPFDPTDGREGDVQIFPPTPQSCPARQDIDIALIDMAEGLVDQRWLLWLDSRAETEAKELAAQWRRETPRDWRKVNNKGAVRAENMRQMIVNLARRFK